MIIGLVTLITMLFGAGSVDVFYIDKIEQGINKNITDKERKKELKVELEDYTKSVKTFNKRRGKEIKLLRKKNLDKTTTEEWYKDFFDLRMQERKELALLFIDQRMELQKNITQEEWDNIMIVAIDESTILKEKELKKAQKDKDKNLFSSVELAINNSSGDNNVRTENMNALKILETEYNSIDMAYDNINVNESKFLADKNATREEMLKLSNSLNVERERMYRAYTNFLVALANNSDKADYQIIVKKLNKAI